MLEHKVTSMCAMVTKVKLEVTAFCFSNKCCFFTVSTDHKLETLDTCYCRLELNAPIYFTHLNCFKFFVNDLTCHKAIIILKVAASIFKCNTNWYVFTVALLCVNTNVSIFCILRNTQDNTKFVQVRHTKCSHKVCYWCLRSCLKNNTTVFCKSLNCCG